MRLDLQTRNASALVANLYQWDRRFQRDVRSLVQDIGRDARAAARTIVPYDTGFMHDHLRLEFSPSGLVWSLGWLEREFAAAGLPFYPPYQEFGTLFMPAQPTLGPAARHVEEDMRIRLAELMRASAARGLAA